MFSEKERNVLQAIVEDEIVHLLNDTDRRDPLFKQYRMTLSDILLKIRVDGFGDRAPVSFDHLSHQLLSRQTI